MIFFGMVGPVCWYVKTGWFFQRLFGKAWSLGTDLGKVNFLLGYSIVQLYCFVSKQAYTYGRSRIITYADDWPYWLQASLPQIIPFSAWYDNFKKWQYFWHMAWLIFTVPFCIKYGGWIAKFMPISLCFIAEIATSIVYESWFGYIIEAIGIDDYNSSILYRLFFEADQLFDLGISSYFYVKITGKVIKDVISGTTSRIRHGLRSGGKFSKKK
jgi:hypothetical protein